MSLVRLVTCSVVIPDAARMPQVAVQGYDHASVIGDSMAGQAGDWCVSLAIGDDFTAIDNDPLVTSIFLIEADIEASDLRALLARSPDELGWSEEQIAWLIQRITERGGDASDLSTADTLSVYLAKLTGLLGSSLPGVDALWAS